MTSLYLDSDDEAPKSDGYIYELARMAKKAVPEKTAGGLVTLTLSDIDKKYLSDPDEAPAPLDKILDACKKAGTITELNISGFKTADIEVTIKVREILKDEMKALCGLSEYEYAEAVTGGVFLFSFQTNNEFDIESLKKG